MNEEFRAVVQEHRRRYPRMTAQDLGKLAYQSEFGPQHFTLQRDAVLTALRREWQQAGAERRDPEDIGGGLCRFHLGGAPDCAAAELLTGLFLATAARHRGTDAGLQARLDVLARTDCPGMAQWLADYRQAGCPAVSHSAAYRAAYAPHYRLLRRDYACWFEALLPVWRLAQQGRPALVAIDGRCGSGKTTLAALLEELLPCHVFHMDDFYLPADRRAPDWQTIPAGNMDLERFRTEVLEPARAGRAVTYRPYDCRSGTLGEGTLCPPRVLTIVEGSYSQHPSLAKYYDLTLFLTCDPAVQSARLQAREGDYYPMFRQRWIPLEERYLAAYRISGNAGVVLDTGGAAVHRR